MLLKIGVILAIPVVLMGTMAFTTDTVFVDVREGGPDGMLLFIPVPMPLARAALSFVDEGDMAIECPELWRYRDTILKVVRELRHAPDGELVRVQQTGTFVSIEKRGNELAIQVRDGESEVEARLPLKAAERFLTRLDDDTFTPKDILAAMNNTATGQLVHVRDGEDEVKVWVW